MAGVEPLPDAAVTPVTWLAANPPSAQNASVVPASATRLSTFARLRASAVGIRSGTFGALGVFGVFARGRGRSGVGQGGTLFGRLFIAKAPTSPHFLGDARLVRVPS